MEHVEPERYERPNWDSYFLHILDAVSKRATCNRGRNAAVIVKDKRILTTGYVGAPINCAHCDDVGHLYKKKIHEDGNVTEHCVRTTHAEANAIAQAARFGISIDGGTLYVKLFPCLDCTKLLINAGIKKVVAVTDYHASEDSKAFLKESGVEFEIVNNDVLTYDNKRM